MGRHVWEEPACGARFRVAEGGGEERPHVTMPRLLSEQFAPGSSLRLDRAISAEHVCFFFFV
jgi:hypothetical protein